MGFVIISVVKIACSSSVVTLLAILSFLSAGEVHCNCPV